MAEAEELVKRFVDIYYLAHTYIDERNADAARDQYKRLLAVYNSMLAAPIAHHHKELAHSQLSKVHDRIQNMRSRSLGLGAFSGNMPAVAAAIIIIAISVLIVMRPGVVGLVSFEGNGAPAWEGPTAFEVTGTTLINLSEFFYDPDGDDMVFVSTATDGLDVIVANDMLEIRLTDAALARANITVMATDFRHVTRVPIAILAP